MAKKIVTYPDPVLTKPAVKVGEITPEINQLISEMIKTMRQAKGVGLAAPQVGQSLKITVIEHRPEQADDEAPIELQVLINPKIITASGDSEIMNEGCLSIPNIEVPVERKTKIKVRALNEHGDKIQFRAAGFHARIIQHEVDHLNGKLIIDYAKNKDKVLKNYHELRAKRGHNHNKL